MHQISTIEMIIKDIVCALEQFAPLPLQDGYDNAGLQIGLTEAEVAGALLCLDVTEAVIDEAIALGCNLIIAHHPLIFKGCKSITGADYVERCIIKAIRNDVAIYAAHTNLDNAHGGVNYMIARKMGLSNVVPAAPVPGNPEIGAGVVGLLEDLMTETEFLMHLKQTFEVECLRHNKLSGREIQTVAICGGAGAFLMEQAVACKADAFVTGEIKYHEFFGREKQILLAEIGHYESEQYTKELIESIIREKYPDAPLYVSKVNTNPIKYM